MSIDGSQNYFLEDIEVNLRSAEHRYGRYFLGFLQGL